MTIKPVYQNITSSDLNKYTKNFAKKDEDILYNAEKRANLKTQNNAITKAQKTLPYIAIGALAVANGIKTPGKLSDKMISSSKVIGTYMLVDALFNSLNGIGKLIANKKTKTKNKGQNNINPLIMIGAGFIGAPLLFGGVDKIAKTILEKKPKIAMNTLKKIKQGFEFFDKTKLASKIENYRPKYKEFALKHPKIISKISNNAFPIILASFVGSEFALASKNNKKREELFMQDVVSNVIKREQARQIIESPVLEISKD